MSASWVEMLVKHFQKFLLDFNHPLLIDNMLYQCQWGCSLVKVRLFCILKTNNSTLLPYSDMAWGSGPWSACPGCKTFGGHKISIEKEKYHVIIYHEIGSHIIFCLSKHFGEKLEVQSLFCPGHWYNPCYTTAALGSIGECCYFEQMVSFCCSN